MSERRRRWRVALRKALRRIVYSRSSSVSIAAGVAMGVFIGLTPTVGFQMLSAALLATVFGLNRLAAVTPVWISNPLTIGPIYYFNFRVGAWILGAGSIAGVREEFTEVGETIGAVSLGDFFSSLSQVLRAMGALGADILVPLIVGSCIVGALGAAAAYPVTLWSVNFVRRGRKLRSARRAQARMESLEAAGLLAHHEEQEGLGPRPEAPSSGEEEEVRDSTPTPPGIVRLPPRSSAPADDDGRGDEMEPPSRANGA